MNYDRKYGMRTTAEDTEHLMRFGDTAKDSVEILGGFLTQALSTANTTGIEIFLEMLGVQGKRTWIVCSAASQQSGAWPNPYQAECKSH